MPTTKAKSKVKTRVSQRVSQKQIVVVNLPEKKTRRRRRTTKKKSEPLKTGSIYAGATFYNTNAQDPNLGRMYGELRDTLNEIQRIKDIQQQSAPVIIPKTGLNLVNEKIQSYPLSDIASSLGFTTPIVPTETETSAVERAKATKEEMKILEQKKLLWIPTDVSSSEQEKFMERRKREKAKFRAARAAQQRASQSQITSPPPPPPVPVSKSASSSGSSIERQIRAGTYTRKPSKATIDKLKLVKTSEGKWVMPDMLVQQTVRS